MGDQRDRLLAWLRVTVVEPTLAAARRLGRCLRYWFCAHWWPSLRLWLHEHVAIPLIRGLNYLCYAFIYVVCGYWLKPLARFLLGQCYRLLAFLHHTLVQPSLRSVAIRSDSGTLFSSSLDGWASSSTPLAAQCDALCIA